MSGSKHTPTVMSALKFVRDAATGDHFSRSGTSYLPWPLAALSIAIHVPATMIGMPLLTAWTLVTLPFRLVREYTQKRAYAKRRAAGCMDINRTNE